MKALSFIKRQRKLGERVADFARTLTPDVLHARMICMEASRQLKRCEDKEKRNEVTKLKRKHIRQHVSKKHAAV